MALTPQDFGSSFKGFLDLMSSQPAEEPVFLRHLRNHFGQEPSTLPIISDKFEDYDHPNLHLALDAYFSNDGKSVQLLGVAAVHDLLGVKLADLVAPASGAGLLGGRSGATEGPVQYVNVTLHDDEILTCVKSGLFLATDGSEKLAILLHAPTESRLASGHLTLEVMAAEKSVAEQFLKTIRTMLRKSNIYLGHVLSLSQELLGSLQIKFHPLPKVERNAIILPEGLLERIERQTIGFDKYSDSLAAAGRHLKRGILLYGPAGTGKTLTTMYLANALRNRTVLVLNGQVPGLFSKSCALARALQPSIVVLEDVDLVAEAREKDLAGLSRGTLHELLNEMDGLADDTNVLFLLTTNRPAVVEPALAARPGRIDQVFEIPLPDTECRVRLFELYCRGLSLDVKFMEHFINRTEGASAAFIRELIRQAALFAADEDADIIVRDCHLDEALHEMVTAGGRLSRSILGFPAPPDSDS